MNKIIEMLKGPLTPTMGFLLILIGLYSITFNVSDAKHKNHRRAEKAALIGGWLYIIGGAALIIIKKF